MQFSDSLASRPHCYGFIGSLALLIKGYHAFSPCARRGPCTIDFALLARARVGLDRVEV